MLSNSGSCAFRSELSQLLHRAKAAQRLQVAAAYAVVAWLLMQVASQIFPFFEIPIGWCGCSSPPHPRLSRRADYRMGI